MHRFVGLALVALVGMSPAMAQPALSQDLAITDYAKASYSGVDTPTTRVLKTEAEFRAFMATTSLPPPIQPRIDFGTHDVLVAAMGTKPSSGYDIEIVKVTLMTGGFTGGRAFVEVRQTAPSGIALTVLTTPIHIVSVPKGAIAYHFNNASAAPFTTLDLTVLTPLTQESERVVIHGNGRAELFRSSPTARYAPVDGSATTAELSAVVAAFRSAQVESLPASIPDPNVYIVAPPTLSLSSTMGTAVYSTEATVGVYGTYAARVRPLVAAIRAIGDRLKTGGTFESITLRYSGGFALFEDEYTVAADGTVTVVRSPMPFAGGAPRFFNGTATAAQMTALKDAIQAADMASLPPTIDDPAPVADVPAATYVTTLSGQDFTTVVTKSGFFDAFEARLRPVQEAVLAIVEPIINPPAQEYTGQVRRSASGYLYLGTRYVPWNDPLAGVLYKALGRQATVKAHVMGQGSRTYLQLESVYGRTTANLNMRTDPRVGAPIIRVIPRFARVEITGRQGSWYVVRFGTGDGWSSADYIRVGN